jgi:hypothetical protein
MGVLEFARLQQIRSLAWASMVDTTLADTSPRCLPYATTLALFSLPALVSSKIVCTQSELFGHPRGTTSSSPCGRAYKSDQAPAA